MNPLAMHHEVRYRLARGGAAHVLDSSREDMSLCGRHLGAPTIVEEVPFGVKADTCVACRNRVRKCTPMKAMPRPRKWGQP